MHEDRLDRFGNWEWAIVVLFLIAGMLFVYGHQNREITDLKAKVAKCHSR